MTSIIIAALGVAVVGLALLAWRYRSLWREAVFHYNLDVDIAADMITACDAEIARLTPLAEIGLRRVKAVEKYEAKHRGVTK